MKDILKIAESIYEDKKYSEKLKNILESIEIRSYENIKQIVLIGEMKYTSIKNVSPKLLYADPEKLDFKLKISGNKTESVTVDDGEYRFTINSENAKNTIAIIRSGYKKSNIVYLCKEFENMGILVINNPDKVNISNDKYLIYKNLEKYSIPQPKSVLIDCNDISKENPDLVYSKLKHIYKNVEDNSKFVCKILGGHGGRGVFICTKKNIFPILQCLFSIKHDLRIIVQEYCHIAKGDIRAHVLTIGNKQKIVDVSMRLKDKDFRTNLSLGNRLEKDIELTDMQKSTILNAAKASGLIWCGVDIIPFENGKCVVIEYNGAPGPPTEILQDNDELKEENEKFYRKLFKTIDEML